MQRTTRILTPSHVICEVILSACPYFTDPTVIDGYWYDDFVYVDTDSVIDSSTTAIYDKGWYGMYTLHCFGCDALTR